MMVSFHDFVPVVGGDRHVRSCVAVRARWGYFGELVMFPAVTAWGRSATAWGRSATAMTWPLDGVECTLKQLQ